MQYCVGEGAEEADRHSSCIALPEHIRQSACTYVIMHPITALPAGPGQQITALEADRLLPPRPKVWLPRILPLAHAKKPCPRA